MTLDEPVRKDGLIAFDSMRWARRRPGGLQRLAQSQPRVLKISHSTTLVQIISPRANG